LRLQWSEIAEAMKPPTQAIMVEATATKRMSVSVKWSGCFAKTSSEAVIERS